MKYIIDIPSSQEYSYDKDFKSLDLKFHDDNFSGMTRFDAEPYTEPDRKTIEDEVWELARRIICPSDCYEDSISAHTKEIFNKEGWEIRGIFNDLSYQEAKSKYEAWKKKKDEIKIGDEVVIDSGEKGCITTIRPSGYIYAIKNDGEYEVCLPKEIHKTGRHFDEVEELLKKMRGEEQ